MPETPEAAVGSKTRRPEDSAFKQQRLPAWQPVLTAHSVLPAFFVIGFAFLPIAIGLFLSSQSVQEFTFDYTQCKNQENPNETCAEKLENDKLNHSMSNTTKQLVLGCKCDMEIDLEENVTSKVFLYYKLTNFFQNHRRYVKSRDDNQLAGKNPQEMPSEDCDPFRSINGKPIAPCGAVANSLFNDTIVLKICPENDCNNAKEVPVHKTGIAWPTDKSTKFQNPALPDGEELTIENLKKQFEGTERPPFWSKDIWDLDTDFNNTGYQNEDFIVWMRTAALPNFRKLYRRVNHENDFKDNLPAGKYKLEIQYNYPVVSFEGTKSLVIANTSWMGGKNNFLAIAYFVVSIISIILGVVFLIIHIKTPLPKNHHNAGQPSQQMRQRH